MGQILCPSCCCKPVKCIVDQSEVEIIRPRHNLAEAQSKMGYLPVTSYTPMSSYHNTPRSIHSSLFPSPRNF